MGGKAKTLHPSSQTFCNGIFVYISSFILSILFNYLFDLTPPHPPVFFLFWRAGGVFPGTSCSDEVRMDVWLFVGLRV